MHTNVQAQSVTKVDAYIGRTFNIIRTPSGLIFQCKLSGRERPITDESACSWVEEQLNYEPEAERRLYV